MTNIFVLRPCVIYIQVTVIVFLFVINAVYIFKSYVITKCVFVYI